MHVRPEGLKRNVRDHLRLLQARQPCQRDLRCQRRLLGCRMRVQDQLLRRRLYLLAYDASHSNAPPTHAGAHERHGVAWGCNTAATCTNNIVPGYYFDATAVTLAGATATSTTCAPGLVGYTTRRCLWNGPNSAAGVWENPVSFCQRTLRVRAELGAERGAELFRAG